MVQIIRDNSIGQALAGFADALSPDPSQAWQAYAFKEKVKGIQTENAQKAFDYQQAKDQRAAANNLLGVVDGMFQPRNFPVAPQIEGPRPMAATMGPMPPVHNPEVDTQAGRLAFARAAARNAILRGGNPEQALQTAYSAAGLGQVSVGGVPTNEAEARRVQTMMTGQLPDAKTPFSEEQRRVMQVEAESAKLKDAVSIPKEGTVLMSPEQGMNMGVQPNANGQYIVQGQGPQDAGGGGMFSGDSMGAQNYNTLIQYKTLKDAGQPIPPQLEMAAQLAWNELYGPKTVYKEDVNGNSIPVPIQNSVPQGFPQPGAPAAAPAPMPVTPAVTGVVQPAAPTVSGPVSAAVPPVSGAPVQPQPVQPAQMPAQPGAPAGVNPTIKGPVQPPTEAASRDATFIQQMDAANQNIDGMLNGGYRPTFEGSFLSRIANSANEQDGMAAFTMQLLAAKARGEVDPNGQAFETQTMTFLNAVLRDESGAAVPIGEYPKYIATLIPRYGDDEKTIAWKTFNRQMAIAARRKGLNKNDIASVALGQNPALAQVLAQETGMGGGAGGAPQQVNPAQARAEAVEAIAKIDASNLPSSEKERRKAEVQRRMNAQIGVQ